MNEYGVTEIKVLSMFQENPQSSDKKFGFWNSFTEQIQQLLRTINT